MDIFSDHFFAPPYGPELELLICCARTRPEPAVAARIQELVRHGVDWDHLLKLVGQHGTLPLLRACLETAKPTEISPRVGERLESRFLANATRSIYAASQLVEILNQLKDEGIRVIAFKGPVLALLAFGDITARHFGDLDLIVAEHDYSRCGDLLVSCGFRRDKDFNYESSYVNETTNVCVDLHQGVVDRWLFPAKLDFERLWERRISISMLGAEIYSLHPEDLVIILSLQLVRDTWGDRVRISKISDLAQIAVRDKSIDWGIIEKEFAEAGCKHMVSFALRLANTLISVPPAKDLPAFVSNRQLIDIPAAYVRRLLCGVKRESFADRLLRVGFEIWALRRIENTKALRVLLGNSTVELLATVRKIVRMISRSAAVAR